MPRFPIRTKPQPQVIVHGPLRGVRDSQRPGTPDPTLAEQALNMRRVSGPDGGGLAQRPGYRAMGLVDVEGVPTWQAVGLPQAVRTWIDANGVRRTTLMADGQLWAFDWTNNVWVLVVDTADLSTASVTLSDTAPRVSLVPFAGKLMISDGVNELVTWDGTAGDAGITQVPNVGPFYGPLTVYYAKLFGILQADTGAGPRATLVWSEENDPTLGYDVPPYNNAWDRPGGQTEPLSAVAATNEALYVFRGHSTIAITGAVNSDFQTAGTRANVSAETGTFSPWSVYVHPQGVFFVDHEASPHLAQYGAGDVVRLGDDCKRTTDQIARTPELDSAWTVYDDANSTLLVLMPDEVNTQSLTRALAFAYGDLQFVGVWRWLVDTEGTRAAVTAPGDVIDDSGEHHLAFGVDDATVALGGTSDGPWADAVDVVPNVPITASVTGPLSGYDLADEVQVRKIEVSLPSTTCADVAISYATSRGQSTPLTAPVPGALGAFVVNQSIVNVDVLGQTGATRRRATAHLAGRGRGVQWTVAHATPGNRFAVDVVRVTVSGVSSAVTAP